MLNDSVLLRLRAQVPEDICAIEVNYYYYLLNIVIFINGTYFWDISIYENNS